MPLPEVHIAGTDQLFNAPGALTDEGTRVRLQQFVQAFAAWIDTNVKT
jgi:hypothetical protein